MNPLSKKILNNIKCPLCNSQLDLWDLHFNKRLKNFNFFCIQDYRHFRIYFTHWEDSPIIEQFGMTILEGLHQFIIDQKDAFTEISVSNIDAEHREIDGSTTKKFQYNQKLFDFSNTNREKILSRIKTILIFQ